MSSSQLRLLLLTMLIALALADNCTDINCQTCPNDPSICTVCKTAYYLNVTCLSCASSVLNCSTCTYTQTSNSLVCNSCASGYALNSSSNTCLDCVGADSNCASCSVKGDQLQCANCKAGFVLVELACKSCDAVIGNCGICNNTILPVDCVDCYQQYYSSSPDATSCQLCTTLIPDCAKCAFQAPYEKAQCSQCIDGKVLSQDLYTCENESHLALIVGVVIGVIVIVGAAACVYYWIKKKRARQSNSFHEDIDSYEKV